MISRDIEGSVFANIHDFKNLAGIFRFTEQNMKFSIKDFFSKWDQNRSFLQIWSHLLKKSLMETFIFCAVYNSLLNYFLTNKLFTPSQSSFPPRESCIIQLLSIIHEIQTAFDDNPTVNVRGVFIDISEAFDKVWHYGLHMVLKVTCFYY